MARGEVALHGKLQRSAVGQGACIALGNAELHLQGAALGEHCHGRLCGGIGTHADLAQTYDAREGRTEFRLCYLGFHTVYLGTQGGEVGFGLLEGLLTHGFLFQQGLGTVHAVLHQAQLSLLSAEFGLQGSVVYFGQQLAFLHHGTFLEEDVRYLARGFEREAYLLVRHQRTAHGQAVGKQLLFHYYGSHIQRLALSATGRLGRLVQFIVLLGHEGIVGKSRTTCHNDADDTVLGYLVHCNKIRGPTPTDSTDPPPTPP